MTFQGTKVHKWIKAEDLKTGDIFVDGSDEHKVYDVRIFHLGPIQIKCRGIIFSRKIGDDVQILTGGGRNLRNKIERPCGCVDECGDLNEEQDHPYAVCKGLPIPWRPLVEVVLVPKEYRDQ